MDVQEGYQLWRYGLHPDIPSGQTLTKKEVAAIGRANAQRIGAMMMRLNASRQQKGPRSGD